MGFGLLKVSYDSIVLPYNDETTPVKLTNVKMLPIIVNDNGVAKNESLDILKEQDKHNLLQWNFLDAHQAEVDSLVNKIGSPVHSLCMPYWIWTPEFNEASREYFQKKKEMKRGPFKNLILNKNIFLKELNGLLEKEVENNLMPFYKSKTLTIADLMIAAHLWGMYIFPEYQFSEKMHHYLQSVKMATHFDYHHDFWK
jgi:glutaredoxin 2